MCDDFTDAQLQYVANEAAHVIMENLAQDSVIVEQRHLDAIVEKLKKLLADEIP